MSTNNKKAGGSPAVDLTQCPHWGKGGRYVIDIATGQRVPVGTAEAVPATESKPDAQAGSKAAPTVKETKHA